MILDGQMGPEEIKKILDSEKTTSVPLSDKVIVHITYQTAWIDEEGRLNLRDDIYGLDKQPISQVSTK
jgi:murein L,D-transpeptidase YcbB/YkuD